MKPMEKMKGIVLRIDKKNMVVVTDEGDFLTLPVPVRRPNPGETVEVNVKLARGFTVPYWMRVAVAMLILVVSLGLAKPLLLPQAVAAVSMDLTSGLELKIDKENKVLEAKANNPEGQKLLQGLVLEGRDIYQAVNLITNRAAELGYLKQNKGSTIMVTVAPLSSDKKLAVDRDRLQQTMHDELARSNYEGYLVVNRTGTELRQEAEKMGLTVNQYLMWERAQVQGNNIDVETIREQAFQEYVVKDKTEIQRMFPDMWCWVGRAAPVEAVPEAAYGTKPGYNSRRNPGGEQSSAPAPGNTTGNRGKNITPPGGRQDNSNCAPGAPWPNDCSQWR